MTEERTIHNARIPYEQRMKHIIEGYRKLYDLNERLAAYARALERKIEQLEKDITYRAAKNVEVSARFVEKNREYKRLLAHAKWLEDQLKTLEGKQ